MDPNELAAIRETFRRYLAGNEPVEVVVRQLCSFLERALLDPTFQASQLDSDPLPPTATQAEKERMRALFNAVDELAKPHLPVVEHLPAVDSSDVTDVRGVVHRYLIGREALDAVTPRLASLLLDRAFWRSYRLDDVIGPVSGPVEEQRLRDLINAIRHLVSRPGAVEQLRLDEGGAA